MVKSSGEPTYRLPDMAYHRDKFEREYDIIIDKAVYSTNTSGEQFPLQAIDYIDLIAPDNAYIDYPSPFIMDAVDVEIINIAYYNQSISTVDSSITFESYQGI